MPGELIGRVGAVSVGTQIAGGGRSIAARSHGTELADLAAFTVDSDGLVASWSVTAARLFGCPASAAAGRALGDVLMAGPDQRALLHDALAEAAAGRVWTGTLALTPAGGVDVVIRCEPLTGLGPAALVIAGKDLRPPGPELPSAAAIAGIGSSLDLAQTAREVVDVAVPGFADLAVLYVPERLLTADDFGPHRGTDTAVVRRLAARLAGVPSAVRDSMLRPGEVLVLGEDTPCFRAMAASSPVLFDHLDGAIAERIGHHPGGPEITARYTAFLAVPLVARGAVVGCAAFGRTAGAPAFGAGDVALAAELASRAAVCIENARLYDRERRTARALQRSLLPGRPRVPAGLEVAHRYQPVGANMVGGDWHDIVPLPGGRAALIVGDTMGHGPEAAAVMVQLRTAAHTLAELELPPEQILHRLDLMAAGLAAAPFATCIYTVIDPLDRSCVVAQAGHLPPVVALPDGTTQVLDLPPGLPLGLRVGSFQASEISLPPGATLALYTDGLVESRSRSFDDGVRSLRDALAAALAAPGTELTEACETVTQALRDQGEDDSTLVLARIRPR
jgi:serine phosphatase RsbU (regulator of sigma subunit)